MPTYFIGLFWCLNKELDAKCTVSEPVVVVITDAIVIPSSE